MKILVTGASGLLGHKLVKELLLRDYEVYAIYNRHEVGITHRNLRKTRLDIVNNVALEDLILKVKPEVIIHAAAYTDVDGCEVDKSYAWKINVEATRSIVRAARVIKSFLIYVSTDYVFDGEKGMYKEDDVPNPINYYGLTKLIGEEIVKSSDLLYTIVRPSAIYGVGLGKLNFALFVANKLSNGETVKALVDQYVSPTLNTFLAQAITEIVELRPMGILHIAGERMNRYEFAVKIAEVMGLPKELVNEGKMNEMKWRAKRPKDSSLNIEKARQLLKTRFYDTDSALKLFAEEYRAQRGAI